MGAATSCTSGRPLAIGLLLATMLWPGAPRAEFVQVLKYVGLHCGRIQKDSLAHPRNEVFVNTLIQDMDSGRTFDRKLPADRPYYREVGPGFVARGPVTTLWSGRAGGLRLLVAMWEHDGGGGSVDQFSHALVTAAKVYFAVQSGGAAGAGLRGAAAAAARAPKPTSVEPEPGPIDRFFAQNMRRVLGANHDLLGHATVRIDGGDWHAAPLRQAHGIRHHFSTAHRRGGADCRAYFRFDRGARVAQVAAPPPPGSPPRPPPMAPGPDRPARAEHPPSPPAPARRGDLLGRNRCDRTIYVALSWLAHDRRWRTAGWTRLEAGRARTLLHAPDNRVVYLHASDGARPAAHDGRAQQRYLEVVDTRFEQVDDQPLAGAGLRREVFHRLTLADRAADEVVDFECRHGLYRVRAHNRCDRTIHVAMHYRAPDGRRLTEGYSPLRPNEMRDLDIDVGEPLIAFYAGQARPTGGNGRQSMHEVVSTGFRHVEGTALHGPNKRRVVFNQVPLRPDRPVGTVDFSCSRR